MARKRNKRGSTPEMSGGQLEPGVLPPHKLFFRPDEAAAILGRSRATVYRSIHYGEVRKVERRGRTMIPRDELERVLADAVEVR